MSKKDKVLTFIGSGFLLIALTLLLIPNIQIGNASLNSPLRPRVAGATTYSLNYDVSKWLDIGGSPWLTAGEEFSIGPAQWEISGDVGGKKIKETWALSKIAKSATARNDPGLIFDLNAKNLKDWGLSVSDSYGTVKRYDGEQFVSGAYGLYNQLFSGGLIRIVTFQPAGWTITGSIEE